MQASEMTWEEYGRVVSDAVVLLPVGSTEQHGRHLPLNVDVVISTNLASLVADQIGGLVLPLITYGYKPLVTSGCGQLIPGTASLNGNTLTMFALDLLRETRRHGCKKFMIMNGHWKNISCLVDAVDLMMTAGLDAQVMIVSWRDIVSEEVINKIFAGAGFEGWDKEHAAITETLLMLFFAPDLMKMDMIIDDRSERSPAYDLFRQPDDIIPKSGVCYKATFASRDKGELLVAQVTNSIVEAVRRELLLGQNPQISPKMPIGG